MISPAVGLAYLAWRFQAGVNAIAGKHAAPATIELLPARFDDEPAFARHCAGLEQLGFGQIDNFEVRTAMGQSSTQRTFLRAFLAPDRSAYAVVYELVSLTAVKGASAGTQKVWAELVSLRSDAESLTTSNGEPPLALLDPNPDRPVQRFPGAESVGTASPPFRAMNAPEEREAVAAITAASPHIVWIGLGTPKQDLWMHRLSPDLGGVAGRERQGETCVA